MTEPIPVQTETNSPRQRSPLARLGCAVGLIFWFLLILSPCILFTLAQRGELTLDLGGAPGQTARLWLVMEADERGLGLSLPSVQTRDDGTALCVQTDVRYYFWQGEADPVSYCECYRRAAPDAAWAFSASHEGACSAAMLSSVD